MPYKDPKNRPTYNKKNKIRTLLSDLNDRISIREERSKKHSEYTKEWKKGGLPRRGYLVERSQRLPSGSGESK